MQMQEPQRKGKVFYGWWIVVGCCFLQAFGLGNMMNAAGIFYMPVCEDLGIGLGPLALYLTVYFFVTTFSYPLVAKILPTKNVNVVLSVAFLALCVGQALMGTYTEVWQWYISGAIYGFAGAFIFVVPATTLVQNWFHKRRGLALGITQCMSGIGGAVFPVVGTALIGAVGWRSTYVIFAVVSALVVLPFTAKVFKFKPADMGLLPYGYDESVGSGDIDHVYPGVPSKKMLGTLAFWCIFLYGGVEALMSGYNTCIPGYAVSIGLGDMFGSYLLSLAQLGYVFATIFIGWLVDRIGAKIPTYLTLVITGLALIGFGVFRTEAPLVVTAFLFGMNSVIITISVPTIISDLFGKKDYAQKLSYMRMSGCFAAFASSAIGFVYDATGRFDISFFAGVGIIVVCLVLVTIAYTQKKKMLALWED